MTRFRTGLACIVYAAFVAYLSFVPFRFISLDFDRALALFLQIRYLDLGAGSRADWVANILMFVPLGWSVAAWLIPHPRARFDPRAIIPTLLLGSLWAVAVEFAQVYFPNRTVSLNDILAEVIGTLLGAVLWSAFATRSRDWWRTLLRGGAATANAALGAYVLAYLVLSFSPFDFVVSGAEIAHKFESGLYGLWMAPVSCGPTGCSVKLVMEMLAVAPFGWWLAMHRGGGRGSVLSAALAGLTIGAILEAAQFLLVSGTSQGASILTRVIGMGAGAWLQVERDRLRRFDWSRHGRLIVLAALLPYLGAVAYVSGWSVGRQWLGLQAGIARLADVQWLPFFYQYFSTEQALIRSTMVHLALYAPVGVAVWLWGQRKASGSATVAAWLAAGLALVAELSKLFLKGKHPDFTDLLIAAVAAWVTFAVLRRATSHPVADAGAVAVELTPQQRAETAVAAVSAAGSLTAAPSIQARLAGAALLAVVVLSVVQFPVWQMFLAIGLAGYALMLWRYPTVYLLVVPAALPLLDLAPLSGRFFWDEFDFLLVTTLGVRLLRGLPARNDSSGLPSFALLLLAASVLISTAIAIFPLAPLDANAFSNYLSTFNALRVAKGYVWAALLIWLVTRDAGTVAKPVQQLVFGLALALLAAVAGVVLERALFVGLADVGVWFRAAGFVSATHVGGAYLEAMLVVLTPFGLALAVGARTTVFRVLAFCLVLLSAVAVLMTLSRAAFAAWLLVVIVFGLSWWMGTHRSDTTRPRWRWRLATVVPIAVLIATTAMLAQSTALRDRLMMSSSDLQFRVAHWQSSLELVRKDALHIAFGIGLGSFPREFYVANASSLRLPAYRLDREHDSQRQFLSLLGGRGMYLDQRVAADAGRELLLRGLLRSPQEGARLAVGLCEKSFLASVKCDWAEVAAGRTWQPFEVTLRVAGDEPGHFLLRVPVSLSLFNDAFGKRIDVTQLSLTDGRNELLSNGAFERGTDRWLMFSDVHLAWRSLSTPVQVIVEQGMLGVIAWLALLGAVIVRARRSQQQPATVAALLAAVIGFVAVSSFDSLLDAPRLMLLVGLLAAASVAGPQGQVQRHLDRGGGQRVG